MNNFDKYTLGNSPACIYIIDLLNNIDRKKAVHIIKSYAEFKEEFRELLDSYNEGALNARIVRKYIEMYRSTLPEKRQKLVAKQYDVKIINLYENLIVGEFKKILRRLDSQRRVEISAIARAKSQLKKQGNKYNEQQLHTYGKFEGKEIPVEVKFNEHGLPSSVVNPNLIKDNITSETLMEKSLKRQERRKQK